MRVNVHDEKIEFNTFSEEVKNVYAGLRVIAVFYGEDFVSENIQKLINHEKVDLKLAKDHKISIQIAA